MSFEFQFARLRGILCRNIKKKKKGIKQKKRKGKKMRRELNFSTLTGRNEEFGFLKKGFKWIFAEGNIVCSGRNHTVHARRQSPRRRFL